MNKPNKNVVSFPARPERPEKAATYVAKSLSDKDIGRATVRDMSLFYLGIVDGDVLLFDLTPVDEIESGQIYAFQYKGELMARILVTLPKNRVSVQAAGPGFLAFEVNQVELSMLGPVILMQRSMSK